MPASASASCTSGAPGRGSRTSTWWSPRRSTACPSDRTYCTTPRPCSAWPISACAKPRASGRPCLAHLPRPYTAVMVGGNAGPYVLDPEAATLLGRAASAFARARGGSLLVSTSARTPKQAIRRSRRRSTVRPRSSDGPATPRKTLSGLPGARRLDHRDLREHVDADRGLRHLEARLHVRPAHRSRESLGLAREPDRQGRHVLVAPRPAPAPAAAGLSDRVSISGPRA